MKAPTRFSAKDHSWPPQPCPFSLHSIGRNWRYSDLDSKIQRSLSTQWQTLENVWLSDHCEYWWSDDDDKTDLQVAGHRALTKSRHLHKTMTMKSLFIGGGNPFHWRRKSFLLEGEILFMGGGNSFKLEEEILFNWRGKSFFWRRKSCSPLKKWKLVHDLPPLQCDFQLLHLLT